MQQVSLGIDQWLESRLACSSFFRGVQAHLKRLDWPALKQLGPQIRRSQYWYITLLI